MGSKTDLRNDLDSMALLEWTQNNLEAALKEMRELHRDMQELHRDIKEEGGKFRRDAEMMARCLAELTPAD